MFKPISLFVFPEIISGNDSSIEGPPDYEYAFGDEFTGSQLNQEMWGLGINEKIFKTKEWTVFTNSKTFPLRMV